ncbi:polysaccharide deacetylase family protein [Gordonia sp. TBRC 11910]|uniref:Polysaccharide deacetylase family protein n=1 Tax=Gordonia asplenii TaxID=2725283 RepID=A0A848KNI8_9ACTN|nr:polysaccharide deacetylase family protein [Gordonia asplenii]NMN99839.1 polysaccharide deacetylase family protein [Gordonia asplenii]
MTGHEPGGQVPVLMYHAVADEPSAATRRLSVTPRALDEQVTFLAESGYTGMTFSELARAFATGAPLPPRPVVFTFDDGYADFAESAWPILRRNDFPATVFVTTGWVADAGPDASGKPLGPMLTWAQVRSLAAAGVEIGAHSHSHPELDQCPAVDLADELHVGRTLLEDCIGAPVRAFAYPFGYSSPRVRLAVRAAGYRCAAAVANVWANPAGDLFRVPRLTIRRHTDAAEFATIMTGSERIFWTDRMLTTGWAAVRAARRARKRVGRNG